jgi:hypothetical protein
MDGAGTPSLDELWQSAPSTGRTFEPWQFTHLPEPAQRYLAHAIASGTPLASAVRLRMHGEIKLGRWSPFTAEEVLGPDRGMIWNATTRMLGIPVRGFDRLLDGAGEMRWKLFGLVPFLTAAGRDITRSGAGRMAGESMWLPSFLCGDDVTWAAPDSSHAQAGLTVAGERTELVLAVDGSGRVQSVSFRRWGNPGGGAFRYGEFGGFVEEEATFDGYTLPTRMRLGWHFGTERFERDGEFFRVTIDEAWFR